MEQLTQVAVERAMKLQDVMLRAMAKRITWYQAAEILGISCRQMQRWKTRFEHEGYEGLFDRRRGVPSPKRVPLETVELVLQLYQEQYFDFNVRHFHEQLVAEHSLKLSYTWVKKALQGAGLVKTRRKRGVHRKRRPRRPLPGMLLHIDASQHRWFCDHRWYDLLVIMDDATSEIYYAQLVAEESTRTVLAALRQVIEQQGVFCALYSDRASHFFLTPKAGEAVDHNRLTQVGRALRELGIQMIPAYSPQARGRSERGFSTWQGRLPQELRRRGITMPEAANRFLSEEYIAEFSARFSVPASQRGTAFVPARRKELELVFSPQHERVVGRDNTVSFANRSLATGAHQVTRHARWLPRDGARVSGRDDLDYLWPASSWPLRGRWPTLAGAKQTGYGNDAPAESDKTRRFPLRLGKVTPKSGLTFPHSHSHYWINMMGNQKTKTGHFTC